MLCVAFAGLGLLAAISVWLSALPLPFRLPLAGFALWHGARLARGEWRQPARVLEFGTASEPPMLIEGGRRVPMCGATLSLRGALATLCWRDEAGRPRSLRWFADTLPARGRRQLRLRLSAGSAPASGRPR